MTFDPITHTYEIDGVELPSVTTILKEAGQIDTTFFKASGTQRGSDVHEATEAIDKGELDFSDFEGESIYPYLEAYKKFKDETKAEIFSIEERCHHKYLGYAGTLDRIYTINGDDWLVDIKTGKGKSFWHGLQLAAYEACLPTEYKFRKRILVLGDNGKYSLVDGYKGIKFSNPMWADYWAAIAKKHLYDREYLK